MKKVFVLVAAVAALSLVSCNKENKSQDAQQAEQNVENAQENLDAAAQDLQNADVYKRQTVTDLYSEIQIIQLYRYDG